MYDRDYLECIRVEVLSKYFLSKGRVFALPGFRFA